MSNIDKQQIREEVQEWKEIYCEPADAENLKFFLGVESLLDELEAKDKLNAELMEKQRLLDICQGQGLEHRIAAEKRAEAAEKRIARALSLLSDAHAENVWEVIGRLKTVISGDYRSEDEIAAAGKGEAS